MRGQVLIARRFPFPKAKNLKETGPEICIDDENSSTFLCLCEEEKTLGCSGEKRNQDVVFSDFIEVKCLLTW